MLDGENSVEFKGEKPHTHASSLVACNCCGTRVAQVLGHFDVHLGRAKRQRKI